MRLSMSGFTGVIFNEIIYYPYSYLTQNLRGKIMTETKIEGNVYHHKKNRFMANPINNFNLNDILSFCPLH